MLRNFDAEAFRAWVQPGSINRVAIGDKSVTTHTPVSIVFRDKNHVRNAEDYSIQVLQSTFPGCTIKNRLSKTQQQAKSNRKNYLN